MIPVIVSSASGTGEYERHLGRMLGPGFEFYTTRCAGDVAELSIGQVRKNKGLFLLSGGDTSIDEMANALMAEFGPGLRNRIGIIPSGTANNTAYNLGFENAADACKLYRSFTREKKRKDIKDHVKATDLLMVSFDHNSLYTTSSFNLGLLARVCNDAENDKSGLIASFFKKLRIKKVSYAAKMIEASLSYDTFDAEIIYHQKGGETGNFILQGLMNINFTNGKQQAGIRSWNPEGCPYDGELEMMCIQEMNLGEMIMAAGRMALIGDHTRPTKDGKGYNRYGIRYLPHLKSVELRIADDNYQHPFHAELGGMPLQLQNTNESVRAELVPSALNFVYRDPHR